MTTNCNYIRKVNNNTWEYDHMAISLRKSGERDKYDYVPRGTAPSMEAACCANNMVQQGASRGVPHFTAIPWREMGCN